MLTCQWCLRDDILASESTLKRKKMSLFYSIFILFTDIMTDIRNYLGEWMWSWLCSVQCRHDAEVAHQQKLLDACVGKAQFPKARTFGKTDTSTNHVFHYLHTDTTEQMYDITVSITAIHWPDCKGVDCLHYITCCIYCIVGLSMAGIV